MANRKATFAKRQRETDLKDRAKQKEDRRTQKRGEVRDSKGPTIAWDEAVYAVTTPDELPSLDVANQEEKAGEEIADGPTVPGAAAQAAPGSTGPTATAAGAPAATAAAGAPAAGAPAAPAARTNSAPIAGAAGKPATSPSPAAPRRVG